MTARSLKVWYRVHKWTSLVCTALPAAAVPHRPAADLPGRDRACCSATRPMPPEMPAGTPRASLDAIVATRAAARPGDKRDAVHLARRRRAGLVRRHGQDAGRPPDDLASSSTTPAPASCSTACRSTQGFMYVMLRLHVDLFAGLPGTLFLGAMGLLLRGRDRLGRGALRALHAQAARSARCGARRAARIRWLDLHNLLGIVTLAWLLVVGVDRRHQHAGRPADPASGSAPSSPR